MTLPVYSAENIGLLTDMLNASLDCIKVIYTDGSLIFMNRSGCEALGVSLINQGLGMEWFKLLPDPVQRKWRFALKKAVNTQAPEE